MERGAGHGAGAERHAVGGLARGEEALLVALEGLDVREPGVGEQHGLGGLEVGVGRDRAVPGGARLCDERALERAQVFDGLFAQAHHAHAHEGCDLVVAAAAGVEPARGLAATPGQLGLDGRVHVLAREPHRARFEAGGERVARLLQCLRVRSCHHAGLDERCCVGAGERQLLGPQAPVERQRVVERTRGRMQLARDAPAPDVVPRFVSGHGSSFWTVL